MHDCIGLSAVTVVTPSGSFKTVNGMEACATLVRNTSHSAMSGIKFQNRKRYGGMRDTDPVNGVIPVEIIVSKP